MSNRIFQAVWDNGPQARSEMIVLMVLADCADAETGSCFPSIAHIARNARMSERTVQRTLSALQSEGWIIIQPNTRKNGSTSSNVYVIQFEALQLTPFVRDRTSRNKGGCQNGTPRQNGTPAPVKMTPYGGCQNGAPITNHKEQRDLFAEWLRLPQKNKPTFEQFKSEQVR